MTGIPLSKIEEAESHRLLNMEAELHKRVVGQEEAIAVVTRAIRRSRAGLEGSASASGDIYLSWTDRCG